MSVSNLRALRGRKRGRRVIPETGFASVNSTSVIAILNPAWKYMPGQAHVSSHCKGATLVDKTATRLQLAPTHHRNKGPRKGQEHTNDEQRRRRGNHTRKGEKGEESKGTQKNKAETNRDKNDKYKSLDPPKHTNQPGQDRNLTTGYRARPVPYGQTKAAPY